MARLLILLRLLIVVGAFAGITTWTLDERTVVKFALTALTLSLL
jgi:hypothetical protein